MEADHRYVVTFFDTHRVQRRRSRTLKSPSGLYDKRADAEAARDKIVAKGKGRWTNPQVVELKRPEKVTLWAKWTPQRAALRLYMKLHGFTLTSGDRSENSLASVGRVSDHWIGRLDSWADDWWMADGATMSAMADKLNRGVKGIGQLKQTLYHNAGSGFHVHTAGYTRSKT